MKQQISKQNRIKGLIDSSLECIRNMVDVNCVIGESVTLPDGSVLIPISKVAVGFVSGGGYPANHYFFYADGTQEDGFIGENGADDVYDDDGAGSNMVEGWFDKIKNSKAKKALSIILKVVLAVSGVVFLVWFVAWIRSLILKNRTANEHYKTAKSKNKKKRKGK